MGVVRRGFCSKGVLYRKGVVEMGVAHNGVEQKRSCVSGVAPYV